MTSARASGTALAALASLTVLGGCESSQAKNARIARTAKDAVTSQRGLEVESRSSSIRVLSRRVLHDENGIAVAIRVHNAGKAQAAIPISFTVRGRDGTTVYKNDVPGLDASLTRLPYLPAGASFTWVNDQIQPIADAVPTAVRVKVGTGTVARGPAPRLTISGLRLDHDDDHVAVGSIRNDSAVPQRRLTIYCTAGAGRHMAAGRAVVERLEPRGRGVRPTRFQAYFIGTPTGALRCSAPPTDLTGARP